MKKLISKVQYKNFEAGEFEAAKERTYEETIELIESFPWHNQKEKIVIDLTNPSVTIEGKNNDFLKFALFYNQKYVLYYFDETKSIYTKTFSSLSDAYDYIKSYFEKTNFDKADFKKEITWPKNNLKHFQTQDFQYVLTSKTIGNYLLSTSGINLCFSTAILLFISWRGFNSINTIGLICLIIIMFLIGGGLHLILFFRYYHYSKDKILIMSRGSDDFYFGNINNQIRYNKKDILQLKIVRSRGSRNQLNGFAFSEIEFNNGKVLKIPNLLIDYAEVEKKLFEYPKIDVDKIPFLIL